MYGKIAVAKPLVILHGDEMAQVAFERILEQFVSKRLELTLVEIDLTAENRLATNGQAVRDAAKQWVFTPAMMNAGPVAVWVAMPFRFALR
mgnify:CR=1 FL=1